MSSDYQITLVTKHTIYFTDRVCNTIRDITGEEFSMDSEVFTDNEISLTQGFIVLIPFSGTIQGNFYLCMKEIVPATLCGMYEEGMTAEQLIELRSDYSSFMLEVINVAASDTIEKLRKDYNPLFTLPPYVIYGTAEMPHVTSGDVIITGDKGSIQCAVSIDLAKMGKDQEGGDGASSLADIKSDQKRLIKENLVKINGIVDKIKDIMM